MYNKDMKFLRKILLTALACLILCGCSASSKTYVAYTIYPLGFLLDRIAGDRVDTISIQDDTNHVTNAQILENYQEIIDNSSYFFHIGTLEPYYGIYEEDFINSDVKSIDLSTLNAIYKFQRYTLAYVDGKETYVEGPYYESDIFNDVDIDDLDLYLWLDPIGMLSMANDICNTLSANYVEQSAFFTANKKELETELINLDASYQNLATKVKKENKTIRFVSMTASFGTWQKAYGFQIYPICLSKYGALPSEQQLDFIKQRIIADGVQYIAYEPNMSEDMLALFNQLENELGLKRINLNNISSLTPSQKADGKDYFALMYENLTVLENIATGEITAE